MHIITLCLSSVPILHIHSNVFQSAIHENATIFFGVSLVVHEIKYLQWLLVIFTSFVNCPEMTG